MVTSDLVLNFEKEKDKKEKLEISIGLCGENFESKHIAVLVILQMVSKFCTHVTDFPQFILVPGQNFIIFSSNFTIKNRGYSYLPFFFLEMVMKQIFLFCSYLDPLQN